MKAISSGIYAALRWYGRTALPPIVVASMGRAGSTLLHDAIVKALMRHRFGRLVKAVARRRTRYLCRQRAFDPDGLILQPGVAYKTHAYPHEFQITVPPKAVFLAAKPSDAALSVLSRAERDRSEWAQRHVQHLRGNGSARDLLTRDALRFADQIAAWRSAAGWDVLFLDYRSLWKREADIGAFLGLDISLPPERERQSANGVDDLTRAQVRESFAALDAAYAELPDFERIRLV